jgi:hypothetical protein
MAEREIFVFVSTFETNGKNILPGQVWSGLFPHIIIIIVDFHGRNNVHAIGILSPL